MINQNQAKIDTYLLQRAKFSDNKNKKGIDKILSFDYMGSSEFEFGALPKSLKRIRASISEYVYEDYRIDGIDFTLFSTPAVQQDFEGFLRKLKYRKIRLKESTYVNYLWGNSEGSKYFKRDFWWSVDEHFMFWIKEDEFQDKFNSLINPK